MKRPQLGICLVLLAVVLALLPSASALSVGSFRSAKERTVEAGETATFALNFYNLGENPARVRLETITQLQVGYPNGRELILEPAQPTRNPRGEGSWFLLSQELGYVRKQTLTFKVHAPRNINQETHNIKVVAEIRPETSHPGSGISQSVMQMNEYDFTLRVIGAADGFETLEPEGAKEDNTTIPEDNKKKDQTSNTQDDLSPENETSVSYAQISDAGASPDTADGPEQDEKPGFDPTGSVVGGLTTIAIWVFTVFVILLVKLRRRY